MDLSPNDGAVHLDRGKVYAMMERYEEACSDFSRAIELDPNQPEGYTLRAKLFLESTSPRFRRPMEAIRDATKSCEFTEWQSAIELALLASAYAANQDFENAIHWQTKALSLSDPTDWQHRNETLESYKKQKSIGDREGTVKRP